MTNSNGKSLSSRRLHGQYSKVKKRWSQSQSERFNEHLHGKCVQTVFLLEKKRDRKWFPSFEMASPSFLASLLFPSCHVYMEAATTLADCLSAVICRTIPSNCYV
jgi:hypothetical protein